MKPDEKEFRKTLSLRLKLERAKQGLNQETLAEKAGISAKHYTKIENSHVTPSSFMLYNLANALDVPMDKLTQKID